MEKKHLVALAAVAAVGVMAYMMRKNATAAADGSVVPITSILDVTRPATPTLPIGAIGHSDGPSFAPIPAPIRTPAIALPAGLVGHSDGAYFGTIKPYTDFA